MVSTYVPGLAELPTRASSSAYEAWLKSPRRMQAGGGRPQSGKVVIGGGDGISLGAQDCERMLMAVLYCAFLTDADAERDSKWLVAIRIWNIRRSAMMMDEGVGGGGPTGRRMMKASSLKATE